MSVISSQHHSFDVALAAKYGVDCAILIHHFQHWVRINRRLNRNLIDGKCWTYQTRKEIQAHFPYWDENHVRRLCEKLETEGVVVVKNYNRNPLTRTLWYAFVDEKSFGVDQEFSNNVYEMAKLPNGLAKLPNANGKIAKHIKDTDTKHTDTEKSSDNRQSSEPAKTLPFSKDLKKKLPKYELSQEEKDLLSKMLEFECPIGNSLDHSFLTVMFKQHGYERVKKAFEFCISKEIKSSLGGLLRTAIKNQWELPNDEFKENQRLCEELASRYPSHFNITQTYMTCNQTGVDVDFRRPTSMVSEQLSKICRLLNLKQFETQEEVPHVTGSWE